MKNRWIKNTIAALCVIGFLSAAVTACDPEMEIADTHTYPVIDTGLSSFYSDIAETAEPGAGEAFYGQDAHYQGNVPSYTDNGETITDNNTGLMWQKDMGEPVSWEDAMDNAATVTTGGYTDWRMPTVKELVSLILYSGQCNGEQVVTKFIDDTYFNQPIGDTSNGEREIDAQTWSATDYDGITMTNDDSAFGVNFVDGRIKCYPKVKPDGTVLLKYVRYVRGNTEYGINKFTDNNDGTVSDAATGLMWQQDDTGPMNWEQALSYAENLELGGYTDWRLPNAKELQSIVDYSKSQGEAAIDQNYFTITKITDPDGENFYPYFWTGTTLLDGLTPGDAAVYVAFGRSLGILSDGTLVDAHGAGAMRSDPKDGNAEDYPTHDTGFQGDIQYVYNYVRCVRDIDQ